MAKPQQILELEKIIGQEIKPCPLNQNIMEQKAVRTFLLKDNKITGLNLRSCNLKNLDIISELRDLIELDLRNNLIEDMEKINKLSNLEKLNLTMNKINDISNLNLKKLRRLSLRFNGIKNISSQILTFDLPIHWEWQDKDGIYLEGNPLESPPPEIIKQGNAAIKAYFDSFKKENIIHHAENVITVSDSYTVSVSRKLNELKVLFVGDGGAGKTSLSKLLRDQTFDPHENQTHGINIDDWKVGDITAHLWDFGGQEIMRATHKFFLSKRSLYVLVLDNREERDEERWLKRIESFGGNSPILIVLNKCEQNASYDVDRRDLVRRYSGLQTQDFYSISCANGQGMEAFKQGLIAAFKRVELINSVLPESWFQVKTALEQQQKEKDYISYNEFQKICIQQQIEETETQDILARLLHDLGVSVHFEDLALLDTHVLEPKWITEGVYKIITSPQLTEQQGVLHLSDLPNILNPRSDLPGFKNLEGLTTAEYIYPPTKYAYLLELMKKFELSYRLNDHAVLIPQLLKPEEPEFAFDDSGQVLRFQILYDYLDDSIMPRFIVALHQDIDNSIQWRKGVLLKNPSFNSQAVVRVNYQDRLLTIVVKGEQKRDYFAVIRKALQDIHASFEWKKPPVELVPLQDNPEFTVEYEELIGHYLSNKENIFVGKLRKDYKVAKLLGEIEKPEQIHSGENHYHFYKGDNVQEKKVAEINQSGSNMKLTPQQEQLIEVLKQINEGKKEFKPTSTEVEALREFQSIVRCLKKAESMKYLYEIDDRMKSIDNKTHGMVLQAWVIGGLTFEGDEVLKNPQKLIIDNNPQANITMTTINQNVTNSTIHGSVVAAEKIENSFNSLQESKASDDAKTLLEQLLNEIKALNDKVPASQAPIVEKMASRAETIINESKNQTSDKDWYQLSFKGIKEAVDTIGEVAKPIWTIAEKLSPLLLAM